jgi:hypothetical protein
MTSPVEEEQSANKVYAGKTHFSYRLAGMEFPGRNIKNLPDEII